MLDMIIHHVSITWIFDSNQDGQNVEDLNT
jgi:hypothetical protein